MKKYILNIILWAIFVLPVSAATPTALFIKGSKPHSELLGKIRHIRFSGGNLILKTNTNAETSFAINGISKISFGEEVLYVCEIGTVKYSTLSEALADHTGGQTIRLLDNITHNSALEISAGKTLTFDLNGFDLIFTEYISLSNGSTVNYTGDGKFNVIRNLSGKGAGVNTSALSIENGSSCTLTGVEITDSGTGSARKVAAIKSNNASVTVNGDVKATSNRDITADSWGIDANSSTITVTGDVTADNTGVWTRDNTTVTIDGSINALRYIMIDADGNSLSISNFTTPTTKTGYLTYTGGTNTVWVKDAGSGISTVSLSETAAIIGYCDLIGRKLQTEPTKGIYIILYDNGTAKKVMK